MVKIFVWIIITLIIGYALYLGLHWIEIRLQYSDIKDKAENILNPASPVHFRQIPDELYEHAKIRNIPLKRDSIRIEINEWEGYKLLAFNYKDSLLVFNRKPIYFRYSFVETLPIERK